MKTSFMKFTTFFFALLVSSLSISLSAVEIDAKNSNPSQYLNNVATQLLEKLTVNKKELVNNSKLAEKLVRDNLLPAIDTELFARLTIGSKSWKLATETQQKRFVNAFINLVINSYAKGLTLYDGQTFQFSDPKYLNKKQSRAIIRSSMKQANSSTIIIDYSLTNKSGSWKIYDLTVEGVSMLTSYKNQFRPNLAKLGMEKFILDLESKS